MNRLKRAAISSLAGLRFNLRSEESFRQEAIILLLCLILGFFIAPNAAWYVAMIGSLVLVMVTELLNTAIERLSDHVTPDFHPRIGAVKDSASAAVFLSIVLAGIVWLTALTERLGLLP